MIPNDIIGRMLVAGALILPADKTTAKIKAKINFKIVQQQFPQYLEELVLHNLNDFERLVYRQGMIAYFITADGDMAWKPTIKGKRLAPQMKDLFLE